MISDAINEQTKKFCFIFCTFVVFRSKFEDFENKDDPHSM